MGVYDRITRAVSGLLGIFSPGAAMRYAAGREQLARAWGYEAGRRDGPNARWLPPDGKADILISRDRRIIQARARQLAGSNPNVGGALGRIVNNVIFTGIWPQAQVRGADGKLDRPYNSMLEAEYGEWAKENGLWEQQQLGLRHCWKDGGFLIHWYPRKELLGRGLVPLGVELLEIDSLNNAVHGKQPNGAYARHGIEFNAYGQSQAYHVWEDSLFGGAEGLDFTPDPRGVFSASFGKSVRLPAERCRLVMLRHRIGQQLPLSWLALIVMTMHDLDEYQSAERIAARLAAAFGVFVVLPPNSGGGNNLDGSPADLAGGWRTDGSRVGAREFVSQGRVDTLPPGADIKTAQSNRPGTNYSPYVSSTLRSASAGISMSAESFSNDYTSASFSSVRQAVLEERRGYRMQQAFMGERFCAPMWETWALWRSIFIGGSPARLPVRHQYPGWQWVDPKKDAEAAALRVKLGTATRAMLCEELGVDFDDVLEGLAEEAEMMRSKGLNPEPPAPGKKEESERADTEE